MVYKAREYGIPARSVRSAPDRNLLTVSSRNGSHVKFRLSAIADPAYGGNVPQRAVSLRLHQNRGCGRQTGK
jgi:hypothetical protein